MDIFEPWNESVTRRSMHWSKEMITMFPRDLFFLVHKSSPFRYTSQMMGGISGFVPKKTYKFMNRQRGYFHGLSVLWIV